MAGWAPKAAYLAKCGNGRSCHLALGQRLYLLAYSAREFDPRRLFAAITVLALNFIVKWTEKALMPWRTAEAAQEIAI